MAGSGAQVTTRFCTDCVNYRSQTALELAAGADNVPMVQLLLHLGASRRAVDCALTRAAFVGSIAIVSLLLAAQPVDEGEINTLAAPGFFFRPGQRSVVPPPPTGITYPQCTEQIKININLC